MLMRLPTRFLINCGTNAFNASLLSLRHWQSIIAISLDEQFNHAISLAA
jgi:hypothetical protein